MVIRTIGIALILSSIVSAKEITFKLLLPVQTHFRMTHVPHDAGSPDDLVTDNILCGGEYTNPLPSSFDCLPNDGQLFNDPIGTGQYDERAYSSYSFTNISRSYKDCTAATQTHFYLGSAGNEILTISMHCRETTLFSGGFE